MQLDYPQVRRPGYFLTHSRDGVSWRSTPRTHSLAEENVVQTVKDFTTSIPSLPEPGPMDPLIPGPSPYPDPARAPLTGHPHVLHVTIQDLEVVLVQHPWQSIPTIYPSGLST